MTTHLAREGDPLTPTYTQAVCRPGTTWRSVGLSAKTLVTCKSCLRTIRDRELGQAFADSYFGLQRAEVSAFEWFVIKSSGDKTAARRRWDAVNMDEQLRQRREATAR